LVAASQAQGQDQAAQARAAASFRAREWPAAAEAYAKIVAETPNNPTVRYRLGISLLRLGKPDEAVSQLRSAEKLGFPAPQTAFALGKAYARLGQRDQAFRELARATGAGFVGAAVPIPDDPDLAFIKDDGRYQEFLTAVDRNLKPCRYDSRYREFDYWVGEWDVRPNGQPDNPPASNVVTVEHEGCVIHEHWSAPGSTGQSFNMFDRSYGKWRQTWVDNTGSQHDYWGNLEKGNLTFEAELPPLPGETKRRHTRLTFFRIAPDTVRQLSESTGDGGKSWQVNYDLIYVRRNTSR
jgi:tetratricopeptide (TPR) repeat protein